MDRWLRWRVESLQLMKLILHLRVSALFGCWLMMMMESETRANRYEYDCRFQCFIGNISFIINYNYFDFNGRLKLASESGQREMEDGEIDWFAKSGVAVLWLLLSDWGNPLQIGKEKRMEIAPLQPAWEIHNYSFCMFVKIAIVATWSSCWPWYWINKNLHTQLIIFLLSITSSINDL